MAWSRLHSVAHDDEALYRLSKNMPLDYDPPEYPGGLCFSVSEDDLKRIGAEDGGPGELMHFAAMCEVTSIFKNRDGCRIELEMSELADEDGKFEELSNPGNICLTEAELEKIGLDADCERGDMIHLIGTARLESMLDTEHGGKCCCLQIVELSFEDESAESRDDEG